MSRRETIARIAILVVAVALIVIVAVRWAHRVGWHPGFLAAPTWAAVWDEVVRWGTRVFLALLVVALLWGAKKLGLARLRVGAHAVGVASAWTFRNAILWPARVISRIAFRIVRLFWRRLPRRYFVGGAIATLVIVLLFLMAWAMASRTTGSRSPKGTGVTAAPASHSTPTPKAWVVEPTPPPKGRAWVVPTPTPHAWVVRPP